MEEQFDTFDEMGHPTGRASRSTAHRQGLWHRAANVFLFLPDGRLLIQRRQVGKDVCPGAWDLSVAEHLKPGESFEEAALRGLREELGVGAITLEAVGGAVKSRLEVAALRIKDYEFQQSFRGTFGGRISPDPAEVMEIRAVGLDELEADFAERPEDFTPWFRRRAAELGLFRAEGQARTTSR
jgi:isopentenyl-diphosphate delta-isomerase